MITLIIIIEEDNLIIIYENWFKIAILALRKSVVRGKFVGIRKISKPTLKEVTILMQWYIFGYSPGTLLVRGTILEKKPDFRVKKIRYCKSSPFIVGFLVEY